MFRTFPIFILLFSVAFAKENNLVELQTESTIDSTSDKTSPTVAPSSEDVPAQAVSWDAELYMTNFSTQQEEKVRKAVSLIKKVISSKEFRDRVHNYTYNGSKAFFDNQGMTNEQVYQIILDGAEKMGNTTKNNTMDVELELYHQATTTIGYTYPNTVRIWMNKKYFNKYTPIKVADNLMHEWMHKLGFTHATTWSKDRDHSVPYAIGYLVEELAAKMPQ
jgi:hypothetical protein